MRSRRAAPLVVLLAVAPLTAGRAEDWPQFRKDAYRTAHSRDRLDVKLAEVWRWDGVRAPLGKQGGGGAVSSKPVGCAAAWRGRLLFLCAENGKPFLTAADLRNGQPLWQRPLAGFGVNRPDAGPAVDGQGLLYAYDTVSLTEVQRKVRRRPRRDGSIETRVETREVGGAQARIRALSALDGLPVAEQVLPGGEPKEGFNPVLPRLFLQPGAPGWLTLLPGPNANLRLRGNLQLGPPLLVGNEMRALASDDLFVRWSPGGTGTFLRVSHQERRQPVPEAVPPAKFLGYPMALTGDGMIIGDDAALRFIAHLQPPQARWHRDWPWTIGVPAVEGNLVFLGSGGVGAHGALVALNIGDGSTRWRHPGTFMPPDPYSIDGYDMFVRTVSGRVATRDEVQQPINQKWIGKVSDAWEPRGVARGPVADLVGYLYQQPEWESVSGHRTNMGVVLADRRVFAHAGNGVVSVDQLTGRLLWRREQRPLTPLVSIIGLGDYLLVCQATGNFPLEEPKILGIRRDTGKLEWQVPVPKAGHLIAANSLVYLNGDGFLACYGPAERTYAMAVDSDRPGDYRRDDVLQPDGDEPMAAGAEAIPAGAAAPGAAATAGAEAGSADPPADADEEARRPARVYPRGDSLTSGTLKLPAATGSASALRLTWDTPLPELLAAARRRRDAAPGVPLLVTLDWLFPDRERHRGAAPGVDRDRGQAAAFAESCAALAAVARPEYFEVAPEVNVYLARFPERLEAVRALVRAARRAIRAKSPDTQVVASFNVEVNGDLYGRTAWLPFERVPRRTAAERRLPWALVDEVDTVGLTAYPQASFLEPGQILQRHLTSLLPDFRGKPVVITRIGARYDPSLEVPARAQAEFLRRLLQVCYWLDAKLVAYPDLRREASVPATSDLALQVGREERAALAVWKEWLTWKRVEALTARVPDPVSPVP